VTCVAVRGGDVLLKANRNPRPRDIALNATENAYDHSAGTQ